MATLKPVGEQDETASISGQWKGKFLFGTNLEIQHVREKQDRDRQDTEVLRKRLVILERVVRLEAQREADREQIKTELARFMLDMERAALRQERSQLTSPPTSEKKN